MEIVTKDLFQGRKVRIFGSVEELLFVAKDIGDILGITNIGSSLRNFDDTEKVMRIINTNGGHQNMLMLTVIGLRKLMFSSRKKEVESFKDWVYDTLKSIRLGKYKDNVAINDLMQSQNIPGILKKCWFNVKNYVLEVIERGDNGELRHVGYMQKVFSTKQIAADYYIQHNPHMVALTVNNNWKSMIDPKTKLAYIIRIHHNLLLTIPEFAKISNEKKPRCSKKQVAWLNYLAEYFNIKIQHAGNSHKEYVVNDAELDKKYYLDGYSKIGKSKIAFEFDGCYWHGCPKCFDLLNENIKTGKRFGELYEKTFNRRSALTRLGYKIVKIRECKYDRLFCGSINNGNLDELTELDYYLFETGRRLFVD